MTRIQALIALAALLGVAAPALAQTASSEVDSGRYVLERSGDGFIRLDTRTGAVSRCAEQSGAWSCRQVNDDRQALQDQVDKLTRENAELRKRVADLEKGGGKQGTESQLNLPSDADMNRMMTWLETWIRRFMAFARSLSQDQGQGQSI